LNNKTLWITRTAIFIALLIAVQFATSFLGNQYVTGSLVNLILIVSVMTCGVASGAVVALVSPFFAILLGIGPKFIQLIPFIALGNFALVLCWHLLAGRREEGNSMGKFIAVAIAAIAKFLVLYLGVVHVAIPFLLALPEPAAKVLSLTFSYPQFVTAGLGGIIALAILPTLAKVIKRP